MVKNISILDENLGVTVVIAQHCANNFDMHAHNNAVIVELKTPRSCLS
jgi:hypothetical protein